MTFSELSINTKGKTTGQIKTICPKCSHTRKNKDEECLSVNLDEKVYNCHHCGWSGTLKNDKNKKIYKLPKQEIGNISQKAANWLISRRIFSETIEYFKITTEALKSPKNGQIRDYIVFPYFRDNLIVNKKYRDAEKNFMLEVGAELILFNENAIKDTDTVYITEGEIDCMSCYEAGIYNVVSIPDGAKKSENPKLEWINNSWEVLKDKKHIIICMDNDEAGQMMQESIAKRFGKDKCYYIFIPSDCKDINDILIKYGKEELRRILKNIQQYPIEGIETIQTLEKQVDDIFHNGYPKGEKLGYSNLDSIVQWKKKSLCVLTGIPNHGKSEWLDQMMIRLNETSNWKWGIFSAENQPTEYHIMKLIEKYIGKRIVGRDKMTIEEYSRGKMFIFDNFYFVEVNQENSTVDALCQKIKELKARYNIDGFIIDNWAKLNHKSNELTYMNEKINMLSQLSKKYDLFITVVVHPTKMPKKTNKNIYEVPTPYNISGTADWNNLADYIVTVYRNMETSLTEIYIQKVRWFFVGSHGFSVFSWDINSGRYIEIS